MPRAFDIVPVPRWDVRWKPPERPRKGFYHCACGYYHDDNGYRPEDYPCSTSNTTTTAAASD